MGAAFSRPEIVETEGGFYIQRMVDPDDEWAYPEYLTETPIGDETRVEWQEYVSPATLCFGFKTQADRILSVYLFAYEYGWERCSDVMSGSYRQF